MNLFSKLMAQYKISSSHASDRAERLVGFVILIPKHHARPGSNHLGK